jgi:hypothetical protein
VLCVCVYWTPNPCFCRAFRGRDFGWSRQRTGSFIDKFPCLHTRCLFLVPVWPLLSFLLFPCLNPTTPPLPSRVPSIPGSALPFLSPVLCCVGRWVLPVGVQSLALFQQRSQLRCACVCACVLFVCLCSQSGSGCSQADLRRLSEHESREHLEGSQHHGHFCVRGDDPAPPPFPSPHRSHTHSLTRTTHTYTHEHTCRHAHTRRHAHTTT